MFSRPRTRRLRSPWPAVGKRVSGQPACRVRRTRGTRLVFLTRFSSWWEEDNGILVSLLSSLFQALSKWGWIGKKRGTSDERSLVEKEGASSPHSPPEPARRWSSLVSRNLLSDPLPLTESLEQATCFPSMQNRYSFFMVSYWRTLKVLLSRILQKSLKVANELKQDGAVRTWKKWAIPCTVLLESDSDQLKFVGK